MQFDFFQKLISSMRVKAPQKPISSASGDDDSLTNQARELLRGLACDALAARVRVRWNARMRTTAGLANFAHTLVTLNPKLAQFGEDEIDRTLRHELAHLLAHHRAGRRRIAPHA